MWHITARADNEDSVLLLKRWDWPVDVVAGSQRANLVHARVTLSGDTREVSDYFSLVYAADQHNFNEAYLVLLDPPIGSAHGIVLEEVNIWDPPTHLVYLDEDLQESRRVLLEDFEEVLP
jgi:hypothetical protein